MIAIAGHVQRSFTFPARLAATQAYFGDFRRIVGLLPHIQLVKPLGPNQFRVRYRTLELGVYDVQLFCDLEVRLDPTRAELRVTALPALPPIQPRATLRSLTAPARYQSVSALNAAGAVTQVDYRLELAGHLPKPLGLNLIPDKALEGIAHSIVAHRIHEIADGFIANAIADYAHKQ